MARASDPTEPLRQQAAAFPEVASGTSCNQTSFKAGKGSFLFIGPGVKGQGYKAMFKLARSLPQAQKLSQQDPDRFQVGNNGWVTTRFTQDEPLPKSIWEKWLKESYSLCFGTAASPKKAAAKNSDATNRSKKKSTAPKKKVKTARKK